MCFFGGGGILKVKVTLRYHSFTKPSSFIDCMYAAVSRHWLAAWYMAVCQSTMPARTHWWHIDTWVRTLFIESLSQAARPTRFKPNFRAYTYDGGPNRETWLV